MPKLRLSREAVRWSPLIVGACGILIAGYGTIRDLHWPGHNIEGRISAAQKDVQNVGEQIGRYWASLNIGDPLASYQEGIRFCDSPASVPEAAKENAEHLCGRLVPQYRAAEAQIGSLEKQLKDLGPNPEIIMYIGLGIAVAGIGAAKLIEYHRKHALISAPQTG